MKKLFPLLIALINISAYAQTELTKQQVQLIAGRALHGTGDMRGLVYATEYTKYFRKRLSWSIALGGSIHDGSLGLFYNDPSGEAVDGSYRYTTAGFQTAGYAGYSFVRTSRHELQFKIGALVRYQSSSYFDGIGINGPALTGYPIPLMEIHNSTPQRTYSIGGSSQLIYNYTINKIISLGVLAGLQTDSNGDTISQLCFSIGRRF